MKKITILILSLFGFFTWLRASSFAEYIKFPEYDCCIDIPSNWVSIDLQNPVIKKTNIIAVKKPDNLKSIILSAFEPPTGEDFFRAALELRKGIRDKLLELGMDVFPDHKINVRGISFITFRATKDNKQYYFYTTAAGKYVYLLNFSQEENNISLDDELNSILNSFSVNPNLNLRSIDVREDRHGEQVGQLLKKIYHPFSVLAVFLTIIFLFFYNLGRFIQYRKNQKQLPPPLPEG